MNELAMNLLRSVVALVSSDSKKPKKKKKKKQVSKKDPSSSVVQVVNVNSDSRNPADRALSVLTRGSGIN